jgi:ubiquinone/menaquinone biosynthesis C-methylase UbiE
MRRTVTPELLDRDAGSPAEIAIALRDLRMVNRLFGGRRTMEALLRRVAAQARLRRMSFLDVAGASGDIAGTLRERFARDGIALEPVLLDRAASHLGNGMRAVAGDALALPFADGSFDVVGSSTFVHHLEPDEVARFAREALRVARVAAVINDLRRSAVHLAFVYSGWPIFGRLSHSDGPASVRRSYTPAELKEILAPLVPRLEASTHYFFRQGFILWKAAAA